MSSIKTPCCFILQAFTLNIVSTTEIEFTAVRMQFAGNERMARTGPQPHHILRDAEMIRKCPKVGDLKKPRQSVSKLRILDKFEKLPYHGTPGHETVHQPQVPPVSTEPTALPPSLQPPTLVYMQIDANPTRDEAIENIPDYGSDAGSLLSESPSDPDDLDPSDTDDETTHNHRAPISSDPKPPSPKSVSSPKSKTSTPRPPQGSPMLVTSLISPRGGGSGSDTESGSEDEGDAQDESIDSPVVEWSLSPPERRGSISTRKTSPDDEPNEPEEEEEEKEEEEPQPLPRPPSPPRSGKFRKYHSAPLFPSPNILVPCSDPSNSSSQGKSTQPSSASQPRLQSRPEPSPSSLSTRKRKLDLESPLSKSRKRMRSGTSEHHEDGAGDEMVEDDVFGKPILRQAPSRQTKPPMIQRGPTFAAARRQSKDPATSPSLVLSSQMEDEPPNHSPKLAALHNTHSSPVVEEVRVKSEPMEASSPSIPSFQPQKAQDYLGRDDSDDESPVRPVRISTQPGPRSIASNSRTASADAKRQARQPTSSVVRAKSSTDKQPTAPVVVANRTPVVASKAFIPGKQTARKSSSSIRQQPSIPASRPHITPSSSLASPNSVNPLDTPVLDLKGRRSRQSSGSFSPAASSTRGGSTPGEEMGRPVSQVEARLGRPLRQSLLSRESVPAEASNASQNFIHQPPIAEPTHQRPLVSKQFHPQYLEGFLSVSNIQDIIQRTEEWRAGQ
ncbi:hypothetical protein DL93DRAFT_2156642 [Clavulina sp. PMI_390]|nr:hypothetical protein DL93DRAFT_2156642 [Clavulina sp. PMI_390]